MILTFAQTLSALSIHIKSSSLSDYVPVTTHLAEPLVSSPGCKPFLSHLFPSALVIGSCGGAPMKKMQLFLFLKRTSKEREIVLHHFLLPFILPRQKKLEGQGRLPGRPPH